jgi:hypothetical protein
MHVVSPHSKLTVTDNNDYSQQQQPIFFVWIYPKAVLNTHHITSRHTTPHHTTPHHTTPHHTTPHPTNFIG